MSSVDTSSSYALSESTTTEEAAAAVAMDHNDNDNEEAGSMRTSTTLTDTINSSDSSDSSDSSMDDDDVTLGPWLDHDTQRRRRRLRMPLPADHGARYGLQHLYGYRHPTSPAVTDEAHGAFVAAKRWDETDYRCCVFYDGAEIRFRYNDDGAEELRRQVKRLTDRGWAVMREPSDMYVTTHGTGLPSDDRPFWR